MTTNTKNIEAARMYWDRQALHGASVARWVVATSDAVRAVGADNTTVMLAGSGLHREFHKRHEAAEAALALNAQPWDFDGQQMVVMPYETFAAMQSERFAAALVAIKAADDFATRYTVAA